MTTEVPSIDIFRDPARGGRPYGGFAQWLRDLPYEVPTAVPEALITKTHASNQASITGKMTGDRFVTRKVHDGTVWVCRFKRESA
jgi:hypothetical protein